MDSDEILEGNGPRPSVVEVEEADYDEAVYELKGWCPNCEEFTTPGVPLGATGRSCIACTDPGVVVGAAHARRNGFISVDGEVLQ